MTLPSSSLERAWDPLELTILITGAGKREILLPLLLKINANGVVVIILDVFIESNGFMDPNCRSLLLVLCAVAFDDTRD